MFSLWGKIRIDGVQGASDAAKAGKTLGEAMGNTAGQQFKSAIMRYLSAGALLGFATRQISRGSEISSGATKSGIGVEGFQELKILADSLGTTVEEVQKMAMLAPREFVRAMEVIRGRGGILNEETVNKLANAADSMKRLENETTPLVAGGADLTIASLVGFKQAPGSIMSLLRMLVAFGKPGTGGIPEMHNFLMRQEPILTAAGVRGLGPSSSGSVSELTKATRDLADEVRRQGNAQTAELRGIKQTLEP